MSQYLIRGAHLLTMADESQASSAAICSSTAT
jgi:hypothetical protein